MKLCSIRNDQVTDSQILEFENLVLTNELESRDIENSLEIMEAILDCIEKEGEVSSSIETMFGENFSSSENIKETLVNEIEASYESIFNKAKELLKNAAVKATLDGLYKKLQAITMDDLKKVDFPVTVHLPMSVDRYQIFLRNAEKFSEAVNSTDSTFEFANKAEKLMEEYKEESRNASGISVEISSAAAFKSAIDVGMDSIRGCKEYAAHIQKQQWDTNMKIINRGLKEMPEDIKKSLPGSENEIRSRGKAQLIRYSFFLYRTWLRVCIASAKAMLQAVGK